MNMNKNHHEYQNSHSPVIYPCVNAMYILCYVLDAFQLRIVKVHSAVSGQKQLESVGQGLQTMGIDCLLESPRRHDLPSHWLPVNEDWALKLS